MAVHQTAKLGSEASTISFCCNIVLVLFTVCMYDLYFSFQLFFFPFNKKILQSLTPDTNQI